MRAEKVNAKVREGKREDKEGKTGRQSRPGRGKRRLNGPVFTILARHFALGVRQLVNTQELNHSVLLLRSCSTLILVQAIANFVPDKLQFYALSSF